MHVGFTVTSPPAHRGLYGCAPVAFASEENFTPGITTAQLVEADELYLSQLNLLRPNASGANASAPTPSVNSTSCTSKGAGAAPRR